jgi:predicted metal-dependent phosphoesterase TrpH
VAVLEPAVELHPHLAEPRAPGTVRVDMHSHTCYSGDAVTTIEELGERVESTGLDVLCITDHHAVQGAFEAIERGIGCRVVVGEEVKTRAGELIGLFLSERVAHGLPPELTAARIRAQGGLVYVPHPFDPVRHALREPVLRRMCADGGIDAIEVLNAKVSLDHLNARAAALAEETGLPGGAGSDAHDPAALGAAYVEMPDFDGPADFLRKLADARAVGHRFDRARAWRPRVIPGGLKQV